MVSCFSYSAITSAKVKKNKTKNPFLYNYSDGHDRFNLSKLLNIINVRRTKRVRPDYEIFLRKRTSIVC